MTEKELLSLNKPQINSVIHAAKNKTDIWGRGTGKSFLIGWDIKEVNRKMPRALTAITGQTYGQLLTRTLPSSFKFLETLGYVKDQNYVIGRKPPKGWIEPMEKIMKYDNVISFANGNAILMLSQDRAGSGRGPNVEYEIVDEAITVNKERYDQETSPTNRGNEEIFGKNSPDPVTWHHGYHYVSSMPWLNEQKWLLDFAKYYEEEAGIQIFNIWNRIVKLQLELIKVWYEKDEKLFKNIWNETSRLKRQIAPFVSKNDSLFTLANAFDNLEHVGMAYIIREYEKQLILTFLIEIMNMFLDKVEDCYYHIDESKHVYFNATNDDYIRDLAEDTNWDFQKLGTPDSRFDLDCDPTQALEIVPDWGSSICLFSIGQERQYDFVNKINRPTDNFINEFYVKPGSSDDVMINELVDLMCNYYNYHQHKTVIYYRDRYGDSRKPNVKSAASFNDQAMQRFAKNGWTVINKVHRGMEPPQHDKYLMWGNMLKGSDPKWPAVRFNGQKCKYTLISMNNTQVVEKEGKFTKNKKSEYSKTILPEEATHFSDAVDKRMWTKYGHLLRKGGGFVPARY